MRIYFGRIPEERPLFPIDTYFHSYLKNCNYDLVKAVDLLITKIFNDDYCNVAYTTNPLILNYFDDEFAKNHVWIIDAKGNHINMGEDPKMIFKLECMGPGDVVCDDYRSFN